MDRASLLDGVLYGVTVHVLIRRVALPEEHDDTHAWLRDLWTDKERALARWEHDGSFEAERLELPLPVRPLLCALVAYVVTAATFAWGALLAMRGPAVSLHNTFWSIDPQAPLGRADGALADEPNGGGGGAFADS